MSFSRSVIIGRHWKVFNQNVVIWWKPNVVAMSNTNHLVMRRQRIEAWIIPNVSFANWKAYFQRSYRVCRARIRNSNLININFPFILVILHDSLMWTLHVLRAHLAARKAQHISELSSYLESKSTFTIQNHFLFAFTYHMNPNQNSKQFMAFSFDFNVMRSIYSRHNIVCRHNKIFVDWSSK